MGIGSKADKIRERSIGADKTMLAALRSMDMIDRKLLLVFAGDRFLGLLSVGDIQRAIIANRPLETPVADILRPQQRIARTGDDPEEIRKTMIHFRTECMPVTDETGTLTDVIFWEDLFPEEERKITGALNIPVVIMAGGMGTRLRPFTNILPKPLMPLDEKTILEHIMDRFMKAGCNRFYLSLNYKAGMIRYYLDNLQHPGYRIAYFQEDKPLGTAGSLSLLKNELTSTFFVSNCDILIEEDYEEIFNYHRDQQNELTLVAALKHYRIPYGTVETTAGGRLTALAEKPEMTWKINAGLYILEPHLLGQIPPDKLYNITDLIDAILQRQGRAGVFPVSEKSWKDAGEWREYLLMINRENT